MLTLRRLPRDNNKIKYAAIDIFMDEHKASMVLEEIHGDISVWSIFSTDWGREKYYPAVVALGNNQPLIINDWLKVYGSKITENGEATIHIKAPKNAKIERRDRVSNHGN